MLKQSAIYCNNEFHPIIYKSLFSNALIIYQIIFEIYMNVVSLIELLD